MIKFKTEKRFREDYRKFIENDLSELSSRTISTYYNNAFNVYSSDKGIDYWQMLLDEDLMEEAKKSIESFWSYFDSLYSVSPFTNNYWLYTKAIDRLKEYVDTEPEILVDIASEIELSNNNFRAVATLVDEGVEEDVILNHLKDNLGEHDKSEFISRVNNYRYLIGKDSDETQQLHSDVLFVYLDTLNPEQLSFALNKIKDNLIYFYKHHGYKYVYRREQLQQYCDENNVFVDFSDVLYDGIRFEYTPPKDYVWLILDDVDKTQYKERYQEQEYYEYVHSKCKQRIDYIPVGAQIAIVNNIKIEDQYHKFFDKGIMIYAKGTVIENAHDGKRLKIDWDTEMINKVWYGETFPKNMSLVRTDYSSKYQDLSDFILLGKAQNMDQYIPEIQREKAVISVSKTQGNEFEHEQYSKRDFLEEVFIDEKEYDILNSLLSNKQNIILEGAPGVGKTYMAKRLAYSRIGEINDEFVMQVQFHQSYSYEDLIMGYRPTEEHFELKTGPFYDFCMNAIEDPDNDYYFIIDEINRGNISKIFGELLMLIETDKRGRKHAIKLMYSGEDFYVPNNVFIIGMMNTADRSLAMIDYAFRRRFAFYPMYPAFENQTFNKMLAETNNKNLDHLVEGIKDVNKEIRDDDSLGKGFMIGHSYFTKDREINNDHVSNILEYEIIPLLEEYWFDDEKKVATHVERLRNLIRE